MFGSTSSRAFCSFSCAGCMSEVWKPPPVFRIVAFRAPFFSARSLRVFTACSVPPHEKPFGKRTLATLATPFGPSFFAASSQSLSRSLRSRPMTETMACLHSLAASPMASPRSFTSIRPSSKDRTPAAHRAVYSPSERPAQACALATASGFSARSFATPARPPTNMAGWQYFVSASLSSGPFMQRSRRSKPRMGPAFASMSFTSGRSFAMSSIFTYWEPWPGNRSATGRGLPPAGAAAGAAAALAAGLAAGAAAGSGAFAGFGAFTFWGP
mmetsp:Transcript_6220/g.13182  ORF Transcript_6220/g.13182 Transcript_6220/m.13182 type:complete len:270 (-) Transcript_6220:527-1336(-)